MLKITVDEKNTYEVLKKQEVWYLNGEAFDGDVVQLGPSRYHVLWRNRSFNVEVLELDGVTKRVSFKINGQLISTSSQDRLALLLESMGMNQSVDPRINEVKAPMPGLIQSIAVRPGDTVQKGDTLLVLVAMKMENVLKSPGTATVKTIRVEAGTTVEKNQVLIEFTE